MEMSPRKCFQFLSHPVFILQVHGWSKKYLLAEKMNLAIISILFVVFTMTEFVAFSGGAPVEGSQTTSTSKRCLWNFVVLAFMRTHRFFAPTLFEHVRLFLADFEGRVFFTKWVIHQKWKHRCVYFYGNLGRHDCGQWTGFSRAWSLEPPWRLEPVQSASARPLQTARLYMRRLALRWHVCSPRWAVPLQSAKFKSSLHCRLVWNALSRVRAGHR